MEVKNRLINNKLLFLSPQNIETDFFFLRDKISEDEVVYLADSIRKNGIIEPVLIRRKANCKNQYILVSGYRRYAALCYLNANNIPAVLLSLTNAEAELVSLIVNTTKKDLSVFEKASAVKRLTQNGKYRINELSDLFGVSPGYLKNLISILSLSNEEKSLLKHKNFDLDMINEYLNLKSEKRYDILTKAVAGNYSREKTIEFLRQSQKPEKKQQKIACLSNDTIILNSLNRMVNQLKTSGINATVQKQKFADRTEYKISIKNSLNQLSFEFEKA